MVPGRCHLNAHFYADSYPDGKAVMITGWWLMEHLALLHSVVKLPDGLICVTPHQAEVIAFLPDRKIRERIMPDGRSQFIRSGAPCPNIVRRSPVLVRADATRFRDGLRAGRSPAVPESLSDVIE